MNNNQMLMLGGLAALGLFLYLRNRQPPASADVDSPRPRPFTLLGTQTRHAAVGDLVTAAPDGSIIRRGPSPTGAPAAARQI